MEIVFDKVNYIYNEKTPFSCNALNDINLSLNSEKVIGIIGKSGSGKTTLIEELNALLIPTSGEIKIDEFNISKNMSKTNINDLRRKVGIVFQFPEEQFFNSTVKEEISFALKHFKYKNEKIQKQVSEALTIVGLDESYLDKNVFEMSAGEKRKVAIASIMVFNPKIVVLDEPTVGLDNRSKKRIVEIIKKLKDRYNKTVIIVSHDVDMLNVIADEIVVMDKGKILLYGSKKAVFNNTDIFLEYNLRLPRIVEFIGKVRSNKHIMLENNTDIKELIKDIYRNV
jgi:energy-coupling factor transport system ATP-binding protein